MELRQLEFFLAVAEERHFTRAASRSHVTQSALSSAIQALERQLGAPLFARTTRSVELTEAGRALLPEARRTLLAANAARVAVIEVNTLATGALAVGGISTAGAVNQASLIARFRQVHPGIAVHHYQGHSPGLLERVARGTLDLAFVTKPEDPPEGVRIIELFSEPVVLACPPGHRLSRSDRVETADLIGEEFIGGVAGSEVARILGDLGVLAGAAIEPCVICDTPAALIDLVVAGAGITFLQRSLVEARPDLCAVALPVALATEWTFALALPPPEMTSAAARAMADFVAVQIATAAR